jgi:hydrogenase maturation protease
MSSRILVAGIGNVFLGDDAFGVEVARRLATRPIAEEVAVKDFGTRGFDLAFALDSADVIIIVDAASRGELPGTLYTIEPQLEGLPAYGQAEDPSDGPDAHAMDPIQVFRLARHMNVVPGRILLVGCEPESFGPENLGQMGMSAVVEAAVDRAVDLIDELIVQLRKVERHELTKGLQHGKAAV